MTPRFSGQVAVVTGAASGLGEGIARRLAAEGAAVALMDRDAARLSRVQESFSAANLAARGYPVDIVDESATIAAFNQAQEDLGPLSILVNSAGIVGPTATKILDYAAADFDQVVSVNLRGSFNVAKAALRLMLPRNYGRILLIASIAGKEGNPGMAGYSASKAGVIGLAKGIAKEYAETGITINALAPAVVMTEMVRGIAPRRSIT